MERAARHANAPTASRALLEAIGTSSSEVPENARVQTTGKWPYPAEKLYCLVVPP
eukprot:CAMPEP_0175547720 /NCGR_PEP_ID=MMETSP0096-20121207/30440_1 /TAXON_ID=311494 /ORGANISM="Alexandrium monilatum, Strain CCMP3105" /LENGTH=54 /DNA_ID=CAMNT_0016850717 /DNA_START=67 /DNA_END=231 /DNA_ORIENTATION=+